MVPKPTRGKGFPECYLCSLVMEDDLWANKNIPARYLLLFLFHHHTMSLTCPFLLFFYCIPQYFLLYCIFFSSEYHLSCPFHLFFQCIFAIIFFISTLILILNLNRKICTLKSPLYNRKSRIKNVYKKLSLKKCI